MGLNHPQAAKQLHVSLRTLQNWLSGTHQIPWAVTRVLRLERYRELPGASWAGWFFSRGDLVTPEGHVITGRDGAWWSMLVRQARFAGKLRQELRAFKASGAAAEVSPASAPARGPTLGAEAGLVLSINNTETPQGNPLNKISFRYQIEHKEKSCLTLSGFPKPSMLRPDSGARLSESALTPSSVSPLTHTSGGVLPVSLWPSSSPGR